MVTATTITITTTGVTGAVVITAGAILVITLSFSISIALIVAVIAVLIVTILMVVLSIFVRDGGGLLETVAAEGLLGNSVTVLIGIAYAPQKVILLLGSWKGSTLKKVAGQFN